MQPAEAADSYFNLANACTSDSHAHSDFACIIIIIDILLNLQVLPKLVFLIAQYVFS